MYRYCALVLLLTLLAVMPEAGWTKGRIAQIEIAGDGLASPIVITDPDVVGAFDIWNGPGVETHGPGGVSRPVAYPGPEQATGRFIDWPKGLAHDRPAGLQRLEVKFILDLPAQDGSVPAYLVAWERDPASAQGFIYLPMWTNSLIWHGVEGNWLHASARWTELVDPIIAKASSELLPLTERSTLSCIAGRGLLAEDGTVELRLTDEAGNETSHWRYGASTKGYERIREHIGNTTPGEPIEISCWPPRA